MKEGKRDQIYGWSFKWHCDNGFNYNWINAELLSNIRTRQGIGTPGLANLK